MSSGPTLYVQDSDKNYPRIRLSDEEYGRAIQAFPVVCSDVVIIDRDKKTIFLTNRASKPAGGWWFIGGRSFVGETEFQSIQRCFKRETGLLIPEERFKFVCMNRYFFSDRQQEPQDMGCDSLCYTMALELTEEERKRVVLDPVEYADGKLREFTWSDLQSKDVRQMFRDFYTKVFA